jgi:hypothetical protein
MNVDRQANDFLIQVSELELMELWECIDTYICEHGLNKLHFFDEYMCERCKKSNVEIKDCPYCGRV